MKSHLRALALAGAILLVACGGSDEGESIEAQDVTVAMYDNRFQYTEIEIPVGGTVTWVGAGRNPHNAVDAGGQWSTESVFGSLEQLEGDEALLTYDTAGTYTFFCTLHGNAEGDGMAGTLIVGEG
ncbi:MAG TPA: plastocyanin/azurin family copper-binding protein [Acidimicrobiia bacterium]|nr:plastocyanin/azurin family copper-binding protein [Acidimicrobiia bacterium]